MTTEKIELTRKELFDILITEYLKKRWWMVLTVFGLAVWMSFYNSNDTMDYLVIGAAIAYPFLIVLQFWGYSRSRDTHFYLQARHYEIDEKKIAAKMDDGTTSTLLFRLIKKRVKSKKYYLLYISNHKFLYVPFKAFKSEEERKLFEEYAGYQS